MVQALAGVTFFQFAQVQAGAEVFTLAVDDGSAHALGHVLEQLADSQDQAVVERVALGRPGEADHGDFLVFAAALEVDVRVLHLAFLSGIDYGYEI